MKRLRLLRLGLMWLLLPRGAYSQDTSPSLSFRKLYSGIGVHGGLGWGTAKNTVSLNFGRRVFLPHGGINARVFIARRLAINPSVDYLSLGDRSKGAYGQITERFRTLQAGLNAEVFLGQPQNKTVFALRGGLFGGQILRAGYYYQDFVYHTSGYSTTRGQYGKWNAGITGGVELIRRVSKAHSLSLYGQYDHGLVTVMNPKDPLIVGIIRTRAYRFGLGYTFN